MTGSTRRGPFPSGTVRVFMCRCRPQTRHPDGMSTADPSPIPTAVRRTRRRYRSPYGEPVADTGRRTEDPSPIPVAVRRTRRRYRLPYGKPGTDTGYRTEDPAPVPTLNGFPSRMADRGRSHSYAPERPQATCRRPAGIRTRPECPTARNDRENGCCRSVLSQGDRASGRRHVSGARAPPAARTP